MLLLRILQKVLLGGCDRMWYKYAFVLIVPGQFKQKKKTTYFMRSPTLNSYREIPADRMCPMTEGVPFSPTVKDSVL